MEISRLQNKSAATLDKPSPPSRQKSGQSGYRPELDVVRLLAFLLVFLSHRIPRSPVYFRSISPGPPPSSPVLYAVANACSMGLCLFFTLSAYLITGLLLQERVQYAAISVRRFYLRRALRIWPLYFLGIGIGIAWGMGLLHESFAHTGFLWYLLFAGNIFCAAHGWSANPMNPLWSISLEEQFYLVWPWAMRWFSRRGLAFCALVFILAANIALFVFGRRHVDTDTTVWANTFVQFEMFATGILLALADSLDSIFSGKSRYALPFAGFLLWFAACFLFHAKQPDELSLAVSGPSMMAGYACIALGCAAILHGFCRLGSAPMPQWAAYLGKISYGLYVFHLLGIDFARILLSRLTGYPGFLAISVLGLAFTIFFAILSYRFFETPFLQLKKRFELVHSRPV